MKISVVIPNYNGENLVKKNLPKLVLALEKTGIAKKEIEMIISDDASRDNSVYVIEELLKNSPFKWSLIKNPLNRGFSSNINRAILAASGEFIVLLNTDVIPDHDFLDKPLSDFEEKKNLFGVGFMDRSIEAGKTVLRGRGLASWKRGLLIHRKGEVDKDDTFWISGGSSIIRREILSKIGSFDSLYDPFYWEDIDLSFRAQKSGFELKFEAGSEVEHKHEEGVIKKEYKSNKIKTIAYRNQFIFIWKNITDNDKILSHIAWLPYHVLNAILRMDVPFLLGFQKAVFLFPKILKKRKEQKKFFVKKDGDIII